MILTKNRKEMENDSTKLSFYINFYLVVFINYLDYFEIEILYKIKILITKNYLNLKMKNLIYTQFIIILRILLTNS
jgi:hypothetical protein